MSEATERTAMEIEAMGDGKPYLLRLPPFPCAHEKRGGKLCGRQSVWMVVMPGSAAKRRKREVVGYRCERHAKLLDIQRALE